MTFNFSLTALPKIEFGNGVFRKLPGLISSFGNRALLITGENSFRRSAKWEELTRLLMDSGVSWQHCTVNQEPSPILVDSTVAAFKNQAIDVVVGIGGGSTLDAAKAIAGLLKVQSSVMDYLEGVGPELRYQGPALPFIAVPTTAGTGSEATKNAVLSLQGVEGFKKSFRDDKLMASHAVIDPDLLSTCPPEVIAANGMDALTQLLESYVSLKANVFTDALALSGIRAVRDSLIPFYKNQGDMLVAREKMAYAALISGITLAQVGLGSVHGVASPLGAFYPIPHGVVCGTLVASATDVNIKAMLVREPENPALEKYAEISRILCDNGPNNTRQSAWDALVDLLNDWTAVLQLPRLSEYGVDEASLNHIVKNARGSSMKSNPIVLTDAEIKTMLAKRL
ncbi:MAG: iron-containing alcohol dehydrogenase [Gammaproteobacteria bacterium]|nr:iron-containing alcohol dehydrogenase [Gammaproteobacteria bacterium]